MKQRKFNLMYLLLIAVFVLSSCAKSSKNSKFIPADAVVVSLDVKQMAEKGKISENAEAKKKLLENVESAAQNQETKDLFKKIVDDPAKAGVDLREPIFVFTVKGEKNAVVGTILNKDDFAALISAAAKETGKEALKEKDGIQYLQDGNSIIAFDDATFFASESYSLDEIVAKFKNDDTKDTMAENDDFAKLADAKGFIKALIPMAILEGELDANAKKMLPEGAELKDLSIILNLNTDKGEARLGFESIAKSDAWKNYIKESCEMCGKIDGGFLKYLPKGAFMMYANFDGKKLFELLDKKGVFAQAGVEEQKEMAKKILEAIDGDFALGVGEIDVNTSKVDIPQVAAYLKTKDGSIADFAKQNGLKPEQGMDFGFKDGATYVAVGEISAFTEVKNGYDKSAVSGRRVYAFCDIAMISNLIGLANNNAADAAKMAGEYVKSAEFYDTSDTAGELVLKMKDADKDPIEFFVEMALRQF